MNDTKSLIIQYAYDTFLVLDGCETSLREIDDFPFYMRWGNAGVTSLNHIMDTVTKNFLTFEKIKTLIKSNNFIRYYTLISNIPTDIKKCLKDNIDNINTENFHPKDDFLDRLINTKSLKFVYITLLKTLTHLPIQKFLKWEEILGIDIADWSIYFRILKKCCRDTYLINFQYKLLHRIIPTNTFLFKIHIRHKIVLILQC